MTPDELRAHALAAVARTRAAQGLPPTVTDPAALSRLSVLFAPRPEPARASRRALKSSRARTDRAA